MRVYVLESDTLGTTVYSSYAAMLTHLKQEYGDYEEDQYSGKDRGCITVTNDEEGFGYIMYYQAHDVLGEHSAKDEKLVFNTRLKGLKK